MAMDEGAKIEIRFCEVGDTRSQALIAANLFAEIIDAPVVEHSYKGSRWFNVKKERIELSAHYGQDSATIII